VSSIDFRGDQLMAAPMWGYDHGSASFRDSGVEDTNRFVQLDLIENRRCFRSMVKDRQCIARNQPTRLKYNLSACGGTSAPNAIDIFRRTFRRRAGISPANAISERTVRR
jgi:hypothetical protein